jgi:hypothetical protein
MEVYQAAEILLKAVHDDINGRIIFSGFLQHQTQGYDERTKVQLMGIYNKALLLLIDEGLCHRGISADIIELGQKGIDSKGNYKKFVKKKKTRNFLEKTRRILPIISFVLFLIGFYITYLKKTSNARKVKARTAQSKKDSILHIRERKRL